MKAVANGIKKNSILSGVILFSAVFVAFLPSLQNGFVNFDDQVYVTDNPIVQQGLTFQGFQWAWTSNVAGNWHPLTMLSHMLDCQFYGLNPAGHHLTSLLLHICNTIFVFWFLKKTTGAKWRSFFVAALFGLHPLHVESVAWVAERKDVLSTFFWLSTLLAYAEFFVRLQRGNNRAWIFYALAFVSFVLGMMSKPMLVTVPFLLLLLDFWPFNRWKKANVRKLLLEKIPFLLVSIVFSAITLASQEHVGAFRNLGHLSLADRCANAVVAYVGYLGKTFYPVNLSAFYPHPINLAPITIALAVIVLAGISLTVWVQRSRRPYMFVGWWWFVGTLVPVIGIVQVGLQAMADRYTYMPLVGIFITLVWTVSDTILARPERARLFIFCGSSALAVCVLLTWRQACSWRNDESLFRQMVNAVPDNWYGHCHLGVTLRQEGRFEEAIFHFNEALRLFPNYAAAYNGLGRVFLNMGRIDEAIAQFEAAIRSQPDYADAYNNLGNALLRQNDVNGAVTQYERAIKLAPHDTMLRENLGLALRRAGRLEEAIAEYQIAIQNNRYRGETYNNLGAALLYANRFEEAITQFKNAARLSPRDPRPQNNLAVANYKLGRVDDAIAHFQESLRLRPDDPRTREALAAMLEEREQRTNAPHR